MPAERLQKIIAAAGLASRRKAETLITSGAVSVNGATVRELGAKADPATDRIKVNGAPIKPLTQFLYILLHKPRGYVTTLRDPEGRKTVMDLIGRIGIRVYPVGRLDYHSEGLLLLTNDGDLANRLTHASSHVAKKYLVKVSGVPTAEQLEQLRRGILISEDSASRGRRVKTAPVVLRPFRGGDNPWFEMTLIEGRNRQIRRMFEAIGHHAEKIKRVQYGPLELDVEAGQFRTLSAREVTQLKRAAAVATPANPSAKDPAPRRSQRPKARRR